MASNFTVVLFQRQHFGNGPGIFNDVEPNVPFAGRAKSFVFDCPNVQASEPAFLMFQSRDVDHPRNVFEVNGIGVFGGLPVSPARDSWNGNVLLVEPHHQLRATGNVLHIESRDGRGTGSGNIDDFIIDNIVLVYKTPDAVALPSVTGDLAAFIKTELLPSMTNVRGSGASANPADQHNEYVLPTASQLGSWRVVFRSLLAGAWADAQIQARTLSSTYNVVRFVDASSERTYYVLMEGLPGHIPAAVSRPSSVTISDPADSSRRGWGTYIFDPVPRRALSLSAPHPHDDLDTAEQAADAYLGIQARTLLIAGTDRDQNGARASCEQSSRPYLEADVAHTSETVFQVAFEEIYASDVFTWHIQFHGNAVCAADVFLSNGVVAPPSLLQTLAANIATASATAAQGGPVLTADVFAQSDDCAARGTDNMQLRFASGLPHNSICAPGNVPIGRSRFIHVEQRRDARRAPTDPAATPGRNRDVVMAAILATFTWDETGNPQVHAAVTS
jgi:hypothetical protein